jgi:hypothetical protein
MCVHRRAIVFHDFHPIIRSCFFRLIPNGVLQMSFAFCFVFNIFCSFSYFFKTYIVSTILSSSLKELVFCELCAWSNDANKNVNIIIRRLFFIVAPNASALALWRHLKNYCLVAVTFFRTAKLQKLIRITNVESLFFRRHNANAMLCAVLNLLRNN